jgi:Flp pilus assembly protein TadB
MPDNVSTETAPSLTHLVSGIVGDVQQLIRQEVQLARTEIKQEWDKARTAAGTMAAGFALLVLAAFMLCFLFVYLLETAGVPLWGGFGIVGGVLALLGLVLAGMGYAQASRVHVIPPQTAEVLKENVSWSRNPR